MSMEQFKRAQIIMLPTNVLSNISLSNKTNNLVHNSNKHDTLSMFTNQHLYIISDNEIKEGDWCYCKLDNKPIQYFKEKYQPTRKDIRKYGYKKIIATTNNSLTLSDKYHTYDILPQPSQQFIKKYIESYNKGEIITDVLVEHEPFVMSGGYSIITDDVVKNKNNWFYEPKVNPKDNTITIKKLKNTWNREEVKKLCLKAFDAGFDFCMDTFGIHPDSNKWIDENL